MSKLYNNTLKIQNYIQKQLGVIRKSQNITQEDLARLINISPKTISDIENNRRGISIKTLIKICNVLKIDLKKVFVKNSND